MKILISTDTSCLINYEVLKKYPISVFNLNVIIDNVEYLDGISIKQDFLYDAMTSNKVIKTSTPPLGTVVEYFENLFDKGYDRIIHFTISSKLSSMYSLFSTVSANYFDNKIVVIDSYSLSTSMLSQVFYAYDAVQNNVPIEDIVKGIEKRKQNYFVGFVPKNLTALKNGGRISPAIAAIGNTIGLKPVILLKDGELVKDSMTTSVKKAFSNLFNSVISKYPLEDYDYSLVDFSAEENILNAIYDRISAVTTKEKLIRGFLPINVCAHCGPGTIGLVISPKISGKSLIEFL